MHTQITSIRSRFILWIILPLTLFATILSLYLYTFLENKVNDFFNKRLFATAQSIKDNLGVRHGKLFVDLPSFSIDFLSSHEKGVVYYSVIDEEGKALVGHEDLFDKRLLGNLEKRFYDLTYEGVFLKVISYKTALRSKGKELTAYITVAESMEERDENIRDMLTILISILSLVTFFVVGIMLLAVKQGLAPLNYLKKMIQRRDRQDLEPLEFDAPKELEDVVESINILLERSRNTIEYIEHFNSDVSHQLRTPIAELKVKLEMIYDKQDPNFISLNRLLDSMSHITEQLLLYAKTNANTINIKRFEPIELNKFCKEYSKKVAIRVFNKGFDYSFEGLDENIIIINSDTVLLESVLDNIINNALHYAVDDDHNPIGTITLSIERHENSIWLSVKDEGKGLDEKHLTHIFDRYYRADLKKQGSGLGLSIVKQIAHLHGARVTAQNDNGLKISIVFEDQKDIHKK